MKPVHSLVSPLPLYFGKLIIGHKGIWVDSEPIYGKEGYFFRDEEFESPNDPNSEYFGPYPTQEAATQAAIRHYNAIGSL